MPTAQFEDFDCEVTPVDISSGTPRDELRYPVSLALQPRYPAARTTPDRLILPHGAAITIVHNLEKLRDWIRRFDGASPERRKTGIKPVTIQIRRFGQSGLRFADAVPTKQDYDSTGMTRHADLYHATPTPPHDTKGKE